LITFNVFRLTCILYVFCCCCCVLLVIHIVVVPCSIGILEKLLLQPSTLHAGSRGGGSHLWIQFETCQVDLNIFKIKISIPLHSHTHAAGQLKSMLKWLHNNVNKFPMHLSRLI
jgi:hypothetical protein